MIEKIRKYKDELFVAAIFFPMYAYFFWCCLPVNEDSDLERILYLTFTYITFSMALGGCGNKDENREKGKITSNDMLLIVKTMVFIVASLGFYGTII